MNLSQKGISGFKWLLTGTLVQNVFQFINLMVLSRLLVPSDFGVVAVAMLVVSFSRIITELGIAPAIIQKVELSKIDILTANTITLINAVFMCAVLIYASDFIQNFFAIENTASVIKALALIIPISGISVVSLALLQRELRFRLIAQLAVGTYLVSHITIGITAAYLGFGVWSLVFATLAQSLIMGSAVLWLNRKHYGFGFEFQSFKTLYRFGAGQSIASFCNYFATEGDNIVIGKVLGATSLGFYSRAYQLMIVPVSILGTVLDKVLFPIMSRMQNDREQLSRLFLAAMGILAVCTFPLATLVILFSNQIVGLVFGDGWEQVTGVLSVLFAVVFFRIGYKISEALTRAVGRVFSQAWRQSIYAVSVILMGYIGHFYGLIGVATGVSIAIVLNFILMAHLVRSVTDFSILRLFEVIVKNILVCVLSATLYVVLIGALGAQISNIEIVNLGFQVGLFLLITVSLYVVAKPLFHREANFVNKFFLRNSNSN